MAKKKHIGFIAAGLIIAGLIGVFAGKKDAPSEKPAVSAMAKPEKKVSILTFAGSQAKDKQIAIDNLVIEKVDASENQENSKFLLSSSLGKLKDRHLFLKHSVIAGDYVKEEDFYQENDTRYMELLSGTKNKMMYPLLFNLPKEFNKTGGIYDGINNEEIQHIIVGDFINIYARVNADMREKKKKRPAQILSSEVLGIRKQDKENGAILYLAIDKDDYGKMINMISSDIYIAKCPIINEKYDCSFDATQRKYQEINEIRG